jgi:hypothetical protein
MCCVQCTCITFSLWNFLYHGFKNTLLFFYLEAIHPFKDNTFNSGLLWWRTDTLLSTSSMQSDMHPAVPVRLPDIGVSEADPSSDLAILHDWRKTIFAKKVYHWLVRRTPHKAFAKNITLFGRTLVAGIWHPAIGSILSRNLSPTFTLRLCDGQVDFFPREGKQLSAVHWVMPDRLGRIWEFTRCVLRNLYIEWKHYNKNFNGRKIKVH